MTDFSDKTISLLIVETTIPPVSRANVRLYQLGIKLMKEKGFHVHMITPSKWPWSRYSTYMDRIIMNQYWGASALIYSRLRILVRTWHFVATILSVIYLSWHFKRRHNKRISVIHAWNPLAGIAAVVAGKLIGAKVFVDFTDFYSDIARTDMPLLADALKTVETHVLGAADRIFVVSEQMKRHLSKTFGTDIKKIHIVPDGVDVHAFNHYISGEDIRTQLGFTKDHTVLIYHGDIKHDDGMDILLDSLEKVHKKHKNVRLVILGGGGAYWQELRKRLDTPPLRDIVRYIGWVPYDLVSKYIAASDIGMMPMRATLNHNLYLSFKLFEYWAMAKPVIVTKLGAISTIFEDGKTGYQVKSNTPQGFASAMERAFRQKRRLPQLGRNGRSLVARTFNWDSIMKGEVVVYKEVFSPQKK